MFPPKKLPQLPRDTWAQRKNAVKPKAGDIGYAVDQEWQNVLIYYGDFITFPKYFNIFARVTENMEELLAVGRRVWTQGIEKVFIKEI